MATRASSSGGHASGGGVARRPTNTGTSTRPASPGATHSMLRWTRPILQSASPRWQPGDRDVDGLRRADSIADTSVRDTEIFQLVGAFLAETSPLAFKALCEEHTGLDLQPTLPQGHPPTYLRNLLQRLVDMYGRMSHAIPGLRSLLGTGNASVLLDKITPPRPPTLANKVRQRELGMAGAQALPAHAVIAHRAQRLITLTGHIEAVYCAIFDAGCRRMITGSDDYLIKIWSMDSADLLFTLRGHMKEICSIRVSQDNMLLASGSLDSSARVWCLQDGRPVGKLVAHTGGLSDLAFLPPVSADGGMLLTAGLDGTCRAWSYDNATLSFSLNPTVFRCSEANRRGRVRAFEVSPGGARFAVGSEDGNVRLFLTPHRHVLGASGEPVPDISSFYPPTGLVLAGHRGFVTTVSWSDSGDRLLSGSYDGTLRVWYFDRNRHVWAAIVLTPAAVEQGTGSRAGGAAQATSTAPPPPPPKVNTAIWAYNDRYIVAPLSNHALCVWDAATGEQVCRWDHQGGEVFAMCAHPFMKDLIVTGGFDGQIHFWNLTLRSLIHAIPFSEDILELSFSADGRFLSVSDRNGRVTLFGFGVDPAPFASANPQQFFPFDYTQIQPALVPLHAEQQVPMYTLPRDTISDIHGTIVVRDRDANYGMDIPAKISQESYESVIARNAQLYALEVAQILVEVALSGPLSTPITSTPTSSRRSAPSTSSSSAAAPTFYGSDVESESDADAAALEADLLAVQAALSDSDDEDFVDEHGASRSSRQRRRATRSTRRHASGEEESESEEESDAYANSDDSDAEEGGRRARSGGSQRRQQRSARRPVRRPRRIVDDEENEEEHGDEESEASEEERVSSADEEEEERRRRNRRRQHARTAASSAFEPSVNLFAEWPAEWTFVWDWMRECQPGAASYAPQVGDDVWYCRQGHAELLAVTNAAEKMRERGLPWERVEALGPVERGTVIKVEYVLAMPPFAAVTIRLEREETIVVDMHDWENVPEFVILTNKYSPVTRRGGAGRFARAGQVGHVMYDGTPCPARVVAELARDPHFPSSPWRRFEVEWLDPSGEATSDPHEFVSPWELILDGAEDRQAPQLSDELTTKLIEVIDEVMKRDMAAAFVEEVDRSVFTAYLEWVAYPTHLTQIRQRLVNHFYRSPEAFYWEIDMLVQNVARFNKPQSIIARNAQAVRDIIYELARSPSADDATSSSTRTSSRKRGASVVESEEGEEEQTISIDDDHEGDEEEAKVSSSRPTRNVRPKLAAEEPEEEEEDAKASSSRPTRNVRIKLAAEEPEEEEEEESAQASSSRPTRNVRMKVAAEEPKDEEEEESPQASSSRSTRSARNVSVKLTAPSPPPLNVTLSVRGAGRESRTASPRRAAATPTQAATPTRSSTRSAAASQEETTSRRSTRSGR